MLLKLPHADFPVMVQFYRPLASVHLFEIINMIKLCIHSVYYTQAQNIK